MTQSTILAIVHQQTSTPGHLGYLLQYQGHRLEICCPALGQPLPSALHAYDGVVIFGGPMSANDDTHLPFIRAELDWIPQVLATEKPLLGICLGAQLLARVLGARVRPHPEGRVEVGYWPLEVLPPAEVSMPLMGLDRVFQWHNEGFDLPGTAQGLARSANFPNQAFVYGSQAYGLQFHPEITLAMLEFWNEAGTEMLSRSGAQPTADQLRDYYRYQGEVHRWLEGFLGQWLRSASPAMAQSPRSPLSAPDFAASDRLSTWDAAH